MPKKADETRLVRVMNMILELASRAGKTKKELAEEFAITPRQVLRDFESLRQVGIVVEKIGDGPKSGVVKRYRIPDKKPFLPGFQLTQDEAFVLAYSLALSRRDVSSQSRANLEGIRSKLNVLLPGSVAQYADGLARLYVPMNQSHPAEEYDPGILRDIESAVLEKTWLRFSYHSRKGEKKVLTVAPHAILACRGRMYLLGHVDRHADGEPVIFSIDQIKDLKNLEDDEDIKAIKVSFPEHTFDAEKWIQNSFGIFRENPMEVEVLFSGDAVESVRRNIFHPSQKLVMLDDGRARVTLRAGGYYEILWWVLGFGAKAEVVKPKKMRDEIVKTFQSALTIYQDGGAK